LRCCDSSLRRITVLVSLRAQPACALSCSFSSRLISVDLQFDEYGTRGHLFYSEIFGYSRSYLLMMCESDVLDLAGVIEEFTTPRERNTFPMRTTKLTVTMMFAASMAWSGVAQAENPCGAPADTFKSCEIVQAPDCFDACQVDTVISACVAAHTDQCISDCAGPESLSCEAACDQECADTSCPAEYLGGGDYECKVSCGASCMGDCSSACSVAGDKVVCYAACNQQCSAHCEISCKGGGGPGGGGYYDDDKGPGGYYDDDKKPGGYYDDDYGKGYYDDDYGKGYYDDDYGKGKGRGKGKGKGGHFDDDCPGRSDWGYDKGKGAGGRHPGNDHPNGKRSQGGIGCDKDGPGAPSRKGKDHPGQGRGGGKGYDDHPGPGGGKGKDHPGPGRGGDKGWDHPGPGGGYDDGKGGKGKGKHAETWGGPTEVANQCQQTCHNSCAGSCTADIARSCELGCQADAVNLCKPQMTASCSDSCGRGAVLMCDGQFVNVSDVDACVAALEQEGISVKGPIAALDGGEILATAIKGASCSVEEPKRLRFAGMLFTLLGFGFGASFLRRRRS
jgi:hypothetical protein